MIRALVLDALSDSDLNNDPDYINYGTFKWQFERSRSLVRCAMRSRASLDRLQFRVRVPKKQHRYEHDLQIRSRHSPRGNMLSAPVAQDGARGCACTVTAGRL
jgi:hypothetical protein